MNSPKLLRHGRTFLNFFSDSVRNRRTYSSNAEAIRVFRIRLQMTNMLKPRVPEPTPITLRGMTEPLYVRRGMTDYLLLQHMFEQEEYGPCKAWSVPQAPRVMDLGANIGLAARYFDRVWPACRVFGVEPDSDNFELMLKNTAPMRDGGRWDGVRAFVAATSGVAALEKGTGDPLGYRMSTPPRDEPGSREAAQTDTMIPCLTMERLLELSGFDRIDVLKCDIEGTESELFANCTPWIDRVDHIIVETHAPYSLDHLYADLDRAGVRYQVDGERRERKNYSDGFLTILH